MIEKIIALKAAIDSAIHFKNSPTGSAVCEMAVCSILVDLCYEYDLRSLAKEFDERKREIKKAYS